MKLREQPEYRGRPAALEHSTKDQKTNEDHSQPLFLQFRRLAAGPNRCRYSCAGLPLASSLQAEESFVQKHGRLSVKGNKIVDKDGVPTTLHGMSLYCWAQQGMQYFNTSAINHFAQDWKCTVIRIAVLPRDYKSNPTNEIDRVKTVMDACIANGIYAISIGIRWAALKTTSRRPRPSSRPWRLPYGKTPNVMYEPWNEPVQEAWTVIKALS